ncbi:MAG: hypothetical protein JJ966_03465 [Balneolaceae bacterium]|nr:hypothetical protein [Balneolaceae bacterium]
MRSSLLITIVMLVCYTNGYTQSKTEKWNWFGGINASYNVAFLENPSNDAFNKYYIDGYLTYGAEVGLHHKRRRISAVFNIGNSIIEPSLRDLGGFDGEIEVPDYFMLGTTLTQQLTRYKEPPNLVFNAGLRTSLVYSNYSGIQATDHPTDPFESTFKDYTMHTFGFESGFYVEIQTKPVNKPGISITLEPLTIGASNKGFRFGATKVGFYINFN